MNQASSSLDHQLLTLLYAVRETQDEASRTALNDQLRNDPRARAAMARLLVDEQALIAQFRDDRIVSLLDSAPAPGGAVPLRTPHWSAWRPLTAAAAGLVFGMLCTSVVFGFVNRGSEVKKVALPVFDASLEDEKQILKDGLPAHSAQWGMDSAAVVPAEGTVQPFKGQRMMRLNPIPREMPVKIHTSRVYQVLDLRDLPAFVGTGDAEVQVSASFCAADSGVSSRYLIRAIVLDEAPEQATKNFWSKVENDGVVSESQRFDTQPGESGWHTFSLKMRLPPGSKTLALIFGAVPPEDETRPAIVHYLDEVQVALLISQPVL
jgi:hypothetical protein